MRARKKAPTKPDPWLCGETPDEKIQAWQNVLEFPVADVAKCRPLLTTTGLMASEACTLDAAYAKYQKVRARAAERLFTAAG